MKLTSTILNFSAIPLRIATVLRCVLGILGLAGAIALLVERLIRSRDGHRVVVSHGDGSRVLGRYHHLHRHRRGVCRPFVPDRYGSSSVHRAEEEGRSLVRPLRDDQLATLATPCFVFDESGAGRELRFVFACVA